MRITREDALHLAQLSAIATSDNEIDNLTADLARIVDYINQLAELDTTGVEPTYQVTGLANVWRDDEIKPQIARGELLKLAPDQAKNQVKVPKVL